MAIQAPPRPAAPARPVPHARHRLRLRQRLRRDGMLLSLALPGITMLGSDQLGTGEALPPQASIQMAILVIAFVPILLVYPFLQRHFAKGVLTGAIKG